MVDGKPLAACHVVALAIGVLVYLVVRVNNCIQIVEAGVYICRDTEQRAEGGRVVDIEIQLLLVAADQHSVVQVK